MFTYIVRRILATIPVMVVVALFVFSLLFIAPGDPAAVIAGDQATPADVERIRQNLGLDRPLDLLQPAGHHHDRAAHRAHPVADADHALALDRGRGADRRARGLEGRHL